MPTKAGMPHADSKIARYLSKQIDAISHEKSQREIALEIGYEKPNMISMIKRGETKVPLEKIPALAKALHVDAGHLYRLAMEQYWPGQAEALKQAFGFTVTESEHQVVSYLRELLGSDNIELTTALKKSLKTAIEEQKKASR